MYSPVCNHIWENSNNSLHYIHFHYFYSLAHQLVLWQIIEFSFLRFLPFSHYRNWMKSDGSCWGGSDHLDIRLFFLSSDWHCVSPLHHHLCHALQPLYKLFQVSLIIFVFHCIFQCTFRNFSFTSCADSKHTQEKGVIVTECCE